MGLRNLVVLLAACGGGGGGTNDAPAIPDVPAAVHDAPTAPLGNRDRLLQSYLVYLKTSPVRQTNGLLGSELPDVCTLWSKLDPSSRATFLTITARLQGSLLATNSAPMLDHVTKLYRAVGGDGATATDPGSCGGGEANRLILQMDTELHAALARANTDKGMSGGQIEIHDIPAGGFWRDSHDLGGPHAPFDLSDETEGGAPRGQLQYFADPASTAANAALGRQDLTTLVDPLALEMDEDFDCAHNSNPACNYTLYGALCAPAPNLQGTAIYQETYGDYGPGFVPHGC